MLNNFWMLEKMKPHGWHLLRFWLRIQESPNL